MKKEKSVSEDGKEDDDIGIGREETDECAVLYLWPDENGLLESGKSMKHEA